VAATCAPWSSPTRRRRQGEHFGYPYCHQGNLLDPKYGKGHKCSDFTPPVLNLGAHMAPLGNRQVTTTTNEANVSYKRWALQRHDPDDGSGFMAILYNRRLAEAREILRVDDRIVVDHYETTGFGWTTSIHFHNGRTISGFRRARGMTGEEWLRMATALLLPAWRTARAVRVGLGKGRLRRQLVASVPLCMWLEYVQGTGHLVGYLLGPGDSPNHLR
jgi:AraC-like DNA-binding protein